MGAEGEASRVHSGLPCAVRCSLKIFGMVPEIASYDSDMTALLHTIPPPLDCLEKTGFLHGGRPGGGGERW